MYRDIEIMLPVLPGACSPIPETRYGPMVAVAVPPKNIADYSGAWGSIAVLPAQIRMLIPNLLFGAYVNRGASIRCTVRDTANQKTVLSAEDLQTEEAAGRWLKYLRWQRYKGLAGMDSQLDCEPMAMWSDFTSSRMALSEYVNRLPMLL